MRYRTIGTTACLAAVALAMAAAPAGAQINNHRALYDALNEIDLIAFPGAPVSMLPEVPALPADWRVPVPEGLAGPIDLPNLPTLPGLAQLGGGLVTTDSPAPPDLALPDLATAPIDLPSLPQELVIGDPTGLPELPLPAGAVPALPEVELPGSVVLVIDIAENLAVPGL